MKLVFIIINKSPITLNWVINLAGKSNTAARAIPYPEGALRRKEAAGPLLPKQRLAVLAQAARSLLPISSGHGRSTTARGCANRNVP